MSAWLAGVVLGAVRAVLLLGALGGLDVAGGEAEDLLCAPVTVRGLEADVALDVEGALLADFVLPDEVVHQENVPVRARVAGVVDREAEAGDWHIALGLFGEVPKERGMSEGCLFGWC